MYFSKSSHGWIIVVTLVVSLFGISSQALPAKEPSSLSGRSIPPADTDTTFISNILTTVNGLRAKHAAKPLTWDATMANFGKGYANNCNGIHAPNNAYGENIGNFYLIPKSTTPDFTYWANWIINNVWYAEVSKYNINNPAPAYHFTQLVWKSSTKIGCSWTSNQCGDANGDYYLYCEFSPKGNIAGQFAANVTP